MSELRLHLADDESVQGDSGGDETKTSARIKKAMEDCRRINSNPKRWAVLNVVPLLSGTIVFLEVGNILSGNFVEAKAATYTYYSDGSEVKVIRQAHV